MTATCTCYLDPAPIAQPRTFKLLAGWEAIRALPVEELALRRGILRHELDQLDAEMRTCSDADYRRLQAQHQQRAKAYRSYAVEMHLRHQAAERAAQR